MSLEAIQDAMALAIDSVEGLRCVEGGYMRDQVNPPEAFIDFEIPEYDATFGAEKHDVVFTVMVFDQRSSERTAQKRLRDWRDPTSEQSLKTAIEGNEGLNAVCDFARVRSAGRPTIVTVGQVDYLMIELRVEVTL